MKTIEEKAKAYDGALERARKFYNDEQTRVGLTPIDLESIFPELKESEGGKIRKWLIEYFGKINDEIDIQDRGKIISWLEKQGTPTDINPSEFDLRLNKLLKQFETLPKEELVNCLSFYLNTVQNDGIYKRAENPADKIEPKFNVGDWVVNTVGDTNQVVKVLYDGYTLDDNTFISNSWATQHYHLWTIADAKEGDVLAISWWEDNNFWEKTIIFKKYHNKGVQGLYSSPCVEGYGSTFENGKLAFNEEVPYYSKTWTCNLHPATKEQRDLLFAKMKEAGYEWDADKKELKKADVELTDFEKSLKHIMIETLECGDTHNLKADAEMLLRFAQKPAWSEEDEKILKAIHNSVDVECLSKNELDYVVMVDWFNALKDRVQPKQEWSEEDEKKRKRIMHRLSIDGTINNKDLADINDWLKSLRPQNTWKPSDEQITVLELASKYERVFTPKQIDILIGLKEQLKKLRGE